MKMRGWVCYLLFCFACIVIGNLAFEIGNLCMARRWDGHF